MKENRKTEKLLTVYAVSEAERLQNVEEEPDKIEPSENFVATMRKMINKADKRTAHRNIEKYAKLVASILVLFSVVFCTAVLPVKANREYFFNLFNHSFTISNQNDIGSSQLFTDIDIYIPTWIPRGYRMTNYNINGVNTIITFTSQEEQTFIFCQRRAKDKNLYDSEVKNLTKLSVGDGEVYFYGQKKINESSNSILIWSNGPLEFSINGILDKNDLIHIAQSIKQN